MSKLEVRKALLYSTDLVEQGTTRDKEFEPLYEFWGLLLELGIQANFDLEEDGEYTVRLT